MDSAQSNAVIVESKRNFTLTMVEHECDRIPGRTTIKLNFVREPTSGKFVRLTWNYLPTDEPEATVLTNEELHCLHELLPRIRMALLDFLADADQDPCKQEALQATIDAFQDAFDQHAKWVVATLNKEQEVSNLFDVLTIRDEIDAAQKMEEMMSNLKL
jgi:hypothetical protein